MPPVTRLNSGKTIQPGAARVGPVIRGQASVNIEPRDSPMSPTETSNPPTTSQEAAQAAPTVTRHLVPQKAPSTSASKRSERVRLAEAREAYARAKLAEKRAEAELAKATMERIEAASVVSEDEANSQGKLSRTQSWVAAQRVDEYEPPPKPAEKERSTSAELLELATALAEITRSQSHAQSAPKYLQELPSFNGASTEWLAFRAAYRDTNKYFSKTENLYRIQRSLKGVAREAVQCMFYGETEPEKVLQALEARFGRPEALATNEIQKLRALPRIADTPRDICIFANKVNNIVATIEALKKPNSLFNSELVRETVEKLPSAMRYRWYDYAADAPQEMPDLIRLTTYLNREAERCGAFAQIEEIKGNTIENRRNIVMKRTQRTLAAVTETSSTSTSGTAACPACSGGHQISSCDVFRNTRIDERWALCKKKNICYRCLRVRKFKHRCATKQCGVNDCRGTHHKLLHNERSPARRNDINEEEETSRQAIVASARPNNNRAYLKMIPITVTGPKASVDTYALLDEGSTVTLVDAIIANAVGAEGSRDPFHIECVAGMSIDATRSQRITIDVKGKHTDEQIEMTARTIERLNLSAQEIDVEDIRRCPHLRDLEDVLHYERATPTILIGQDNWPLIITRAIRSGGNTEPAASLTRLGWVLHGVGGRRQQRVHFVYNVTDTRDDIEDVIKKYFDLDGLGVQPRRPKSDPEQRALDILENTSRRLSNGRYEAGLLWRHDEPQLPNNYEAAVSRLRNLEKRLDRNPELKTAYTAQIEHMLNSGYAEEAVMAPIDGKTWYLPHFAVVNPSKPKPRIVHDAAARSQGTSLNDKLLPGPDLLQSLPAVIMKFRQHNVAVAADIKEMFLQISIREEDRDALRFLWRGNRREGPPTEYRMTRVVFGAASSPCTAIYVKNRNAGDHSSQYPEAAEAIVQNHYMDDYLQSFRTTNDALRVAQQVAEVHRQAHFCLQKWASNDEDVLAALAPAQEHNEVKIQSTEDEKVLGLIWRPNNDTLAFNLNMKRVPENIATGQKRPTKREALKTVMSVFDPLGLITPLTIAAKHILQRTWKLGIDWDQEIPDDLFETWASWLERLRILHTLELPRCYPGLTEAASRELHTFVDASETAYTAAVYWRTTGRDGTIRITLAMAKGRVAPLKVVSVPRLELQAALMGVRLAQAVREGHDLKPDTCTYWSDSKTVLTWIKTGARNYKPFVAHRLAEIEENTKTSEWRWVPTALNVADDATREPPSNFDSAHRWFQGPTFLYKDDSEWPKEDPLRPGSTSTGEERVHAAHWLPAIDMKEALPDIERFSSWQRLIRATARVLQFIELCTNKQTEQVNSGRRKRTKRKEEADPDWRPKRKPQKQAPKIDKEVPIATKYVVLEARYIWRAEELWLRAVQNDTFCTEVTEIQAGRPVPRCSRLRALCVILAEDGVLRIKSRIEAAADVAMKTKSPAIVDGDHPYVRLYIQHVHERLHHGGVETTRNELRQQLWVLRLRPTVRKVIRSCRRCRIRRVTPAEPITGNLPAARLAHHQRPFTYVGLDYFGPYNITVGRQHHKRYGALFTCLTTRAVHIELAGSLSTDSVILALRRMMARRGCPTEIWCDNGTNFVGADGELKKAAHEAAEEEASRRAIQWRFIPPGAPFMGGAWERLVQSIKKALNITLHERFPHEEVLTTLLLEAEHTINSRPLTHVSVSEEDPEALTPNHFLLGGPSRVPTPGTFTEADTYGQRQWRHAQRLADIFWARWVREYLPTLQYRREPQGRGEPPTVGDLVIIVDETLPRNVWPRGRVVAVYPGADGIVRVVDVQTSSGVLRRPTKKIVVLPK